MAPASSSGSYKRARGHSNSVQVPSCLVDGCVADLSNFRDYHRRHKVCEAHSKTPRVSIEGQEKRFCQQCSRFHSLSEFDDTKRSCRKRLDGHNRRRRKPQPDSLSSNSSKYISTHQGPEFISHGTQYFPNSAVATSSWNNAVKVPNLQLDHITNSFLSSFPHGYNKGKQLSFMQGAADASVHLSDQLHLNPSSTLRGAGGSSSSNNKSSHKLLFCDGLDPVTSFDRASSLLSSSQAKTFGFNPMHSIQPQTRPSFANTTSNFPSACSDGTGSIVCPEMIQSGSDPSNQTVSSWD